MNIDRAIEELDRLMEQRQNENSYMTFRKAYEDFRRVLLAGKEELSKDGV